MRFTVSLEETSLSVIITRHYIRLGNPQSSEHGWMQQGARGKAADIEPIISYSGQQDGGKRSHGIPYACFLNVSRFRNYPLPSGFAS